MMLLAIDTSSGPGSLALAREDGWHEVVALPPEWKSTTLHLEIAGLLSRNNYKTGQVDAYAVASGPGTFTGLRIGLTAVKALAEVHGKPVVAISTLEVLARAGRDQLEPSHTGGLAALMDARRGQIFGAFFRFESALLTVEIPDCVCSLNDFLGRVRSSACEEVTFCLTEPERFADEIQKDGWAGKSIRAVDPALAGTLARIGFEHLRQGRAGTPDTADANYVRASDAELFWKG